MDFLGWLGFALFQIYYFPQSYRMWRTRQVQGLSLFAWGLLWLGMLSYLLYALSIKDVVFIAGNGLGLIQVTLQIALILRYRPVASGVGEEGR